MTSLYHYQKGFDGALSDVTFSDYIRMANDFDSPAYDGDLNRVSYWDFHVRSWIDKKDCLIVSFDDLLNNYENTLQRISKFINEPINENIQSTIRKPAGRLQSYLFRLKSRLQGVRFSSVSFRKGVSGDWENYFSDRDLAFFRERAEEINKKLGYQ